MELESKLVVGLKIFTSNSKTNYHIINHHSNYIFQRNQIPSSHNSCCFLKSCFLCHKHLSLNKDVYMYRGDQGFCSEECRSRQMYIDDLTQLEISVNKMKIMRQSLNAPACSNHRFNRKSTPSPIFL